MAGRLYHLFVLLFWLASMTWLVVEKVLPPLLGGSPPDYQSVLEEADDEPDCWKIVWNNETIGFAASQVFEHAEGAREMRSVVQFEDLPLDTMLSELLGVFSRFARPLFGNERDYRIDAILATRMTFDQQRRLSTFTTILDLSEMPSFLTIRGAVNDERTLAVVARIGGSDSGTASENNAQVIRHEIDLPPNALVGDAFTPRAELKNLHVGQSWTIPVYRAFPPNSPMQIVEAKVEHHDLIFWEGNDVETFLIVYRMDAGAGLSATSDAVGREWVRRDGMVLRQEVAFSALQLRFERLPLGAQDPRKEMLDEARYPRYWREAQVDE